MPSLKKLTCILAISAAGLYVAGWNMNRIAERYRAEPGVQRLLANEEGFRANFDEWNSLHQGTTPQLFYKNEANFSRLMSEREETLQSFPDSPKNASEYKFDSALVRISKALSSFSALIAAGCAYSILRKEIK